jgi:hypothetical protein
MSSSKYHKHNFNGSNYPIERILEFLKQIGCSAAVIESVTRVDTSMLENRRNLEPLYCNTADCFQRASTMGQVYFQHCLRYENMVTHHLASQAYRSKEVLS